MKKILFAILAAGLLSNVLCACDSSSTTGSPYEEQEIFEESDYNSTSVLEQTKEEAANLEESPVGIKYYREIKEDFIYKQTVSISDDGTIDIMEDKYSTSSNDRVDGGRIFGRSYLHDYEAIWNPEDKSYTIEKNMRTGPEADATTYMNYYKISFLSIDTICLECYSTLEQEDKDIQRLNGEYHDYDTIQTAPIDISTPTPKAFEDECSSGGAHLWVGYKRSGLVICSKCDEHYSLYTVRKKKGLHLTSVEKAMIYWVLDSYLTATDKNGRYAYSQEEAFSLAERDCGVTRQFLEDNIWYGHAWNDYEQYYTR